MTTGRIRTRVAAFRTAPIWYALKPINFNIRHANMDPTCQHQTCFRKMGWNPQLFPRAQGLIPQALSRRSSKKIAIDCTLQHVACSMALYSHKAVQCVECLEAGLHPHLGSFLVSFQKFLFGCVEPIARERTLYS